MAFTVWGAFDAFRRDSVDLASSTTSTARSSRDYLFGQLKLLDTNDSNFPDMIWSGYLSFAGRGWDGNSVADGGAYGTSRRIAAGWLASENMLVRV